MGKMTNIYIFAFENQIKVGQTGNVKQRLRNIETQSGREATSQFSIKADGKYENLMHKILSEYRGVGEYFTFPFEHAVSILKSLVRFEFAKEVKEGSQLFLPLTVEKAQKPIIIFENGKKFFTAREMAEILGINLKATNLRIFRAGIKPVSKDALYDENTLEAIRSVPGKGRPKAKPEAQDKPKKGKK
jgi:hypothetical protein